MNIYQGDCVELLPALPDDSISAVITDPPYLLGFMGKAWDTTPAHEHLQWHGRWAAECLRVLKPGGHLLAFGGTRTYHRLACAIEDAGFEIRDSITWLYGSGFPKSLDVSKAIDKAAGAQREVVGPGAHSAKRTAGSNAGLLDRASTFASEPPSLTAPATPAAQQWQGWGTALKPAFEPLVVAQKPAGPWDIVAGIGSHLDRLEAECRSIANAAAPSSSPTRADAPEGKIGTAPANAATPPEVDPAATTVTGAADASSDQTDTSPSEPATPTSLSIVSSWRRCWAVLSQRTSTSTTAITSSTTTDLKTLLSCLAQITGENMPASLNQTNGSPSLVEIVDSLFAACVLRSNATLALSADGNAFEPVVQGSPDETARAGSPASEPIVVARKPLAGTVAANVLKHGTGAINVDATRVPSDGSHMVAGTVTKRTTVAGDERTGAALGMYGAGASFTPTNHPAGRWPANVVLTHTPGCVQTGTRQVRGGKPVERDPGGAANAVYGKFDTFHDDGSTRYADADGMETVPAWDCAPGCPVAELDAQSGASRFFPTFRYQAKAPRKERPQIDGAPAHPTVKPLELMRWLVRLVTPPGGIILDPFAGSGTTVEAAILEGFPYIAIEQEPTYLPLIHARIERATA